MIGSEAPAMGWDGILSFSFERTGDVHSPCVGPELRRTLCCPPQPQQTRTHMPSPHKEYKNRAGRQAEDGEVLVGLGGLRLPHCPPVHMGGGSFVCLQDGKFGIEPRVS